MQIELHELELRYAGMRISDPARRGHLLASLARQGQQSPVLVVPEGAPPFVLIDGYARVEALRELGRDLVEALVLDVSEDDALILAHRLETKRRRSVLEEGWLLEILSERGLSQSAIAARLQRSVSWVCRRLALVRALPEVAQAAVRQGVVPPQGAMKFLVPLSRDKAEHCERLVAGLEGKPVSVRETERLYLGWKRADEATRERILSEPHLFLRAKAAVQPDPPVPQGDPALPLVNDLAALAGLSRRGRRRLLEGLIDELDERRRALVGGALEEARLACASLFELLQEELECSTRTSAPRC